MNVIGKIEKILPKQEGVSKKGVEWQKIGFILKTDAEWNNLYHFELFGEEKVSEFISKRELGSVVNVFFNVKTSEHKGRYYTNLDAWKTEDADENSTSKDSRQKEFNKAVSDEVINQDEQIEVGNEDDLPF